MRRKPCLLNCFHYCQGICLIQDPALVEQAWLESDCAYYVPRLGEESFLPLIKGDLLTAGINGKIDET